MLVDLVRTTCRDGVRLDGAIVAAADNAEADGTRSVPTAFSFDAVLCLHGVGANFYSSGLFEKIGPALSRLGVNVLLANTRGHDWYYSQWIGGSFRQLGAAYEVVAECCEDVRTWLEFLRRRGWSRVLLAGHSLGAIKSVYAVTHEPELPVAGLLAISPPRLSYAAFEHSPDASPEFLGSIRTAQKLVEEGRGNELFWARHPFNAQISAGSYLDKYGPAERYNIYPLLDRLPCPALFTFGSKELASGGVPFAGLVELVQQAKPEGGPIDLEVVPDADHVYSGVQADLIQRIEAWLKAKYVTTQA
ncbi:MAG TPA: alpha/beta hydrolase [Pirellulaceae bacterium]|nr:alpha/beta hydrolase [Pirellulaceae bacterium]